MCGQLSRGIVSVLTNLCTSLVQIFVYCSTSFVGVCTPREKSRFRRSFYDDSDYESTNGIQANPLSFRNCQLYTLLISGWDGRQSTQLVEIFAFHRNYNRLEKLAG